MNYENILKNLYRLSPMDFYYKNNDVTIIKSTNNTNLMGYKFNQNFDDNEIDKIWQIIRFYKRLSVIIIFILFITLLYEFIFPKFTLFLNNSWYVNAFIMLTILSIINQSISAISTKIFEKKLFKKYGEFEKVIFKHSDNIDEKYYSLFKSELLKSLVALILIIISTTAFSPFEYTKVLIDKHRYKDAIKIATIGAKILPVAPEWHSLMGYANFQLENYDKAIKNYDNAHELSTEGLNIMNFDNKIFIKYYLGEYESAITDFDNEINNAKNDSERDQYLWDKAQFLYNTKKYNDAITLYNDLIVKAENDRIFLLKDRLYLERAQVFKKLGKHDLAKEDIINAGITNDLFGDPIPKPMLMLDEETFYSY